MKNARMTKCLIGVLSLIILASGGYWLAPRDPSPTSPEPEKTIDEPLVDTTPSRTSPNRLILFDSPDQTAPAVGFFQAVPGQEFSFKLNVRWQTSMKAEPQPEAEQTQGWVVDASALATGTEAHIQMQATMRVAVLDYTAPAYVLRVTLDNPHITGAVGQQHSTLPLTALDRPFMVRFQNDGRVLGYHFEDEVSPEVRRILATVVANSHQFLVRQDTEKVSGLRDEIGAFTGQFTWEPSPSKTSLSPAVRRRVVLSYDELGDAQASKSVRVVQSASMAHFRRNGWITRAQVQEERVAHFHGVQLGSRLVLIMEHQGATTVALDPTALRAVRWEFPSAEGDVTGPTPENKPSDPDEVRRRTTDTVANLDALIRAGQYDQQAAFKAWASLAELISQSPTLVLPQLEELLRSGTLDPTTERYAISAIGKAGGEGTAEAVATLHNFLTDPTTSAERRLSTIVSSHQLGSYAGPIRDDLLNVLQQGAPGEAGDLSFSAAALARGTLIGTEGVEEGRATLTTLKEQAFTRGQPSVYFEALANSGKPELIAEAFSYVDDPNAETRQGVLRALAKLEDDPRAVQTLVRKAQEGSEETGVRQVAIEELGEFRGSPEAVQTLMRIADGEADEAIRTGALLALGRLAHAGVKEVLPTLRRAAADTNPSISSLAGQMLEEM
jgi:HEAT repeat protein